LNREEVQAVPCRGIKKTKGKTRGTTLAGKGLLRVLGGNFLRFVGKGLLMKTLGGEKKN